MSTLIQCSAVTKALAELFREAEKRGIAVILDGFLTTPAPTAGISIKRHIPGGGAYNLHRLPITSGTTSTTGRMIMSAGGALKFCRTLKATSPLTFPT